MDKTTSVTHGRQRHARQACTADAWPRL